MNKLVEVNCLNWLDVMGYNTYGGMIYQVQVDVFLYACVFLRAILFTHQTLSIIPSAKRCVKQIEHGRVQFPHTLFYPTKPRLFDTRFMCTILF